MDSDTTVTAALVIIALSFTAILAAIFIVTIILIRR